MLRKASGVPHGKVLGEDIPAGLANPTGHQESAALMQVNDALLALAAASWERPFLMRPNWEEAATLERLQGFRAQLQGHLQSRRWIDKDPRLCLTRDALGHILLVDLPAIAVLRHPFAVCQSLFLRDGLPTHHSLALWLVYHHHLYNSTSRLPDISLLLDDLLDPCPSPQVDVANRLNSFLETALDGKPTAAEITSQWMQEFVDPSLLRSKPSSLCFKNSDLASSILQLWQQVVSDIRTHAGTNLPFLFRSALIDLMPQLSMPGFWPPPPGVMIDEVQAEMDTVRSELKAMRAEADTRMIELEALRRSTSWRLTAPLRWSMDRLRRRGG
jgi:hypothetical protein